MFNCNYPSTGAFDLGTGTASDPYVVCTPEQFMLIGSTPAYLASHYVIGRNLDFASYVYSPIGESNTSNPTKFPFTGSLDGNNLTIRNLSVLETRGTYAAGLFAHTNSAAIRNLRLNNVNVEAPINSALLVGHGINTSFENIYMNGTLTRTASVGTGFRFAALVGLYEFTTAGSYYVRDININANIRSDDQTGMLFGRLYNTVSPGVNLVLENISAVGSIEDITGGNTNGGIGGMITATTTDFNFTLNEIRFSGLLNFTRTGGTWLGGGFGQFHLNGANNRLSMSNIDLMGTINTSASHNQNGVVAGFAGAFSFTNSTGVIANLDRISSRMDINITANTVGSNNRFAGLFGDFFASGTTDLQMSLTNSYFDGTLSSVNANTLNSSGGVIGQLSSTGTITNLNLTFSNLYSNFRTNLPSITTFNNTRGLIGNVPYNTVQVGASTTFLNNYYFTDSTFNSSGSAEPFNNAENVLLTPAGMNQQSSFVGWNFSTVWRIDNGSSSPRLR